MFAHNCISEEMQGGCDVAGKAEVDLEKKNREVGRGKTPTNS